MIPSSSRKEALEHWAICGGIPAAVTTCKRIYKNTLQNRGNRDKMKEKHPFRREYENLIAKLYPLAAGLPI